MPRKTMELRWPARGVDRRECLRSTPDTRGPWGTPWSVNTRLEDSLTARLRGGSFVGIAAGSRPSEIVYLDRLLTFDGNDITASRQGDHSDLDFSRDISDMMRATVFQFSEAGEVGSAVVALIPHKDSFLLGFTAGETWVQQGDPLMGQRRNVSREVGIIGANAWCINHETVFFLSSHGLYSVGANGSGLKQLSESALPEDLTGVVDAACTLTYNHADRGVYIHKTGVDWFYDTERGGFWPFDTSTTDSDILIGPFRLGQVDRYGRVLNLRGVTAENSAAVTWGLVTADTAEEAADNGKLAIEGSSGLVASQGSWSAGRNRIVYPRTRAAWCCLWLHSEGAWAFEGITMTTLISGQWR